MAAVDARARADIHNVISGLHRLFIVLHHYDGIAQVAQVLQRLDKPCIIPLVQPNGGLIQDIQHPHQAGTDLGRQPDALTFPAGKGAGAAGQGQVVESHIAQERKPALDLLDDLSGDFLLHIGQFQRVHKLQRVPHTHLTKVADVDAAHCHRQYFGPQAVAVAVGAGDRGHESGDIIPHPFAAGLLKAPLQVIHDALKVIDELALKARRLPHHLKFFALSAKEHQVQLVLWHILYRYI